MAHRYALLVPALGLAACVQILGDDFAIDPAGDGGSTSDGGAGTTGGGGTTSTSTANGGATSTGGGGASAGGAGGMAPSCGQPGEACCTSGAPCERLTCLNDFTCPEIALQVQVPKRGSFSGTYGIDETEVTRRQYEQWLAGNPTNSGPLLGPGCAGNTEFAPLASCMTGTFVCQGANCGDHPQVCVDWCDAFAYCAAVGKKLCNHVQPNLNSNTLDDDNAFVNACTSGGVNDYSPGSTAGDCRTGSFGMTHEVKSVSTCQSPVAGFEGVYDLTGNVSEWIDVCTLPSDPNADCTAAGGNFSDDQPYEMCIYPWEIPRINHRYVVGFRCCSI